MTPPYPTEEWTLSKGDPDGRTDEWRGLVVYSDNGTQMVNWHKRARRIVLCVNACVGMTNRELAVMAKRRRKGL